MSEFFIPCPKPAKKEKKAYKGLQAKKPLQAKQGLQTKRPLQAKQSLKAKSAIKTKPKIVEKIPGQKRKKKTKPLNELKVFKGTPIPSKSTRNEFSDRERGKINDSFGGAHCAECGNPYIHHHHAKFRSGSGRGKWRNGVPLCNEHHDLCHDSRAYADKWRKFLEDRYGPYYYMDEWDLWLMGLIEEPKVKDLEAFMEKQELKIKEGGSDA